MNTRAPEVSVTVPLSQALERVKVILFRPFDLGKWFTIGFCAWLAYLGEQSGGSFPGGGSGNHQHGPTDLHHEFDHARDYLLSNLAWIIPVAIGVVVFVLALWVLFVWLGSRGKFMFLHCVALNRGEVTAPWHRYAQLSNSLFVFRLGLGLVGSALCLLVLAMIIIPIVIMIRADAANVPGVMMAAGGFLLFLGVALVFALIASLTEDFVVPIMYLRGTKCLTSWRELRGLLSAHVGDIVIYFLFKFVLGLAIGIIIIALVLITCCIAGCLMAIPYLGTVLLLPVFVFKRAYSLHYLAQFGREYDVFPPPERTPPIYR